MSREALAGNVPDASFDTWALSVTLFEAMTGVNPFLGSTAAATLGRLGSDIAPNVREYLADCPTDVGLMFDRLLTTEPDGRPSSARQLRIDLEQIRLG
jgi:serine/threonine protein kinase